MAEEAKKDEKEKKPQEVAEETPEQDAKKRKKKRLILAVVAAVLVLGGGAGAFLFLSGGKKDAGDAGTAGHEEVISKDSVEAEKGSDGHDAKKAADPTADDKGKGAKDEKKDAHGEDKGKDKGKGEAASKEAEAAEKKPQIDIDFGETFKMQTFNLNLGNALENRYIRLEVTLEYRGGETQKQEIERRMPQLRDAVISIVQRKTREFLLSPDGKESLRKEVLTRINRYMKTRIESVYITDLLIE